MISRSHNFCGKRNVLSRCIQHRKSTDNQHTQIMKTADKKVSDLSEKQKARFWYYVNKDGKVVPYIGTPCWQWEGAVHQSGYGRYGTGKTGWRVHRLSWALANGDIPKNLLVMHLCDNTGCVNPSHLKLGTEQENTHDMIRKGRFHPPTGENHPFRKNPDLIPRGECRGGAKLNPEKVIEMRKRYSAGGISMNSLGKQFGVSASVCHSVVRGKTWKHVNL
jgi:hypothetical protein